jgi:hypothetical protein
MAQVEERSPTARSCVSSLSSLTCGRWAGCPRRTGTRRGGPRARPCRLARGGVAPTVAGDALTRLSAGTDRPTYPQRVPIWRRSSASACALGGMAVRTLEYRPPAPKVARDGSRRNHPHEGPVRAQSRVSRIPLGSDGQASWKTDRDGRWRQGGRHPRPRAEGADVTPAGGPSHLFSSRTVRFGHERMAEVP